MTNITTKKPRVTNEIFIARSIEKHGNKYDYSSTFYSGMRKRLTIICRNHGNFIQIANVHLNGSGCPKCKKNRPMNSEIFKSKSILKHGDTYIYDKSIYTGSENIITITCKIHGDFDQVAKSHLRGGNCPNCRKHVIDNETFIEKSKSIYGDKYSYLGDSFTGYNKNVKVVCREHGVFEQKMDNHFRYDGCKKCKTQRKMINAAMACREDRSSYKRNGYIKICKDNNGMSNLYVVKMMKDGEKFYKVGITKNSISVRFRSNPYEVKKIRLITGDAGFIFDLEKQLHKILSKHQYRPLIKFEGSALECFSKIPNEIIGLIDNLGKSNQLQLLA